VKPLLMLLSGLPGYSLERGLLVERLQAANAELTQLALTDPLTGLSNRRAILNIGTTVSAACFGSDVKLPFRAAVI
jgi:GGDEF domain-containing protein